MIDFMVGSIKTLRNEPTKSAVDRLVLCSPLRRQDRSTRYHAANAVPTRDLHVQFMTSNPICFLQ